MTNFHEAVDKSKDLDPLFLAMLAEEYKKLLNIVMTLCLIWKNVNFLFYFFVKRGS